MDVAIRSAGARTSADPRRFESQKRQLAHASCAPADTSNQQIDKHKHRRHVRHDQPGAEQLDTIPTPQLPAIARGVP